MCFYKPRHGVSDFPCFHVKLRALHLGGQGIRDSLIPSIQHPLRYHLVMLCAGQPLPAAAAIAAAASGLGPIQQPQQQQQKSQPAAASCLQGPPTPTQPAAAAAALQLPPMQQHQLAAVPSAKTTTLQPMMSLEQPCPDPPPSLWAFFHAEATPCEKYPTADVLWRQTERDRV